MKFRSLEKANINYPIIGFGAAPLEDLFQKLSEKNKKYRQFCLELNDPNTAIGF